MKNTKAKRKPTEVKGWRSVGSRLLLVSCLFLALACGGGGSPPPAPPPPPPPAGDILVELGKLPGVGALHETTPSLTGTRFFTFTFQQPVDQRAPGGATFPQTVTLLFRSYTAPMVLASTGYGISRNPSQGEPTNLLQANQLTVEHRFFNTSTPAAEDWSKLDIFQAASDLHRLTLAFKPLFTRKWLNSGGSKGGMTSIYHRRFFPSDVDATLAYVAPINLGNPDPRYVPFVDSRGTPETRTALDQWQQAIFTRRAEVRALLEADAARQGRTLALLGADKALEFAVIEAPFTLWQYSNAGLAAQVPAASASAQQLYGFLDAIYFGVVASVSDDTLTYYAAYYYQCATQLGYPDVKTSHLSDLLFPGQDVPENYPPFGVTKTYSVAAMNDVQAWVSTEAQRLLFVYGENDPWTAGAFQVPAEAGARDNHLYIVPAGNHGSRLSQLPTPQRTEAYALLSTWMATALTATPAPPPTGGGPPDLDATFLVRPRRASMPSRQ